MQRNVGKSQEVCRLPYLFLETTGLEDSKEDNPKSGMDSFDIG